MAIVNSNATSQQLRDAILQLVRALAGKAAINAAVRGVQLRIGVSALSCIQRDFITKSRGGTGQDGITWKPLSPATIARRRVGPGELKSLGITGKRVRGFLTPSQDAAWKKTFARTKAFLMGKFGMGEQEAAGIAAGKAWNEVKAMGARTKLEVLGNRKVDILRDTGELLRSLSPGIANRPSNADGQVFRVPPGAVVVGTNKKPWHHSNRPFWRHDGSLPSSHWNLILGAARRGVFEAVEWIAQGGAP